MAIHSIAETQTDDDRPSKRTRLTEATHCLKVDKTAEPDHLSLEIATHPLGIKPSGNAYGEESTLRASLGALAKLPDELIIVILEFMDAVDLVKLGQSSKACYAFCHLEELWRTLSLRAVKKQIPEWLGSWRTTCLKIPSRERAHIDCTGLFSDTLYRSFQCARLPTQLFAQGIPESNTISRLESLSQSEFQEKWLNLPFVLKEPVQDWPIFKEETRWTADRLLQNYGSIAFRAESVDWPLSSYIQYMRNCPDEESPLYLFDRAFAAKMALPVGTSQDREGAAYWPPQCFGEDLFSILGDQRPDCRWLIMGPEGSGSTFHKDPNCTSAWNAVITGSKYWLMFPPGQTPPGIFLSDDAAEITAPLSIAEYLLTFHAEARASQGCREGICHAGEVLHVPAGWFHLVVNLEESVAVTQNFVPVGKLVDVLSFLKDKPDQVSGFSDDVVDPYGLFLEKLLHSNKKLAQAALEQVTSRNRTEVPKKRGDKWERLVHGTSTDHGASVPASFSFGFAPDETDS